MTEREECLLTAAFGDERIGRGRVKSAHLRALEQLRAAERYLKERYPGRGLEIRAFAPATGATVWSMLYVQNEVGKISHVTVTPTETGWTVADTCAETTQSGAFGRKIIRLMPDAEAYSAGSARRNANEAAAR